MLGGLSFYDFPQHWKEEYLGFLKKAGAGRLADMIRSTCEDGQCILDPEAFDGPWVREDMSYSRFLRETGLWKEEQSSKEWLDGMIRERGNNNG